LLAGLCSEIKTKLLNGRIIRIQQRGRYDIVIKFSTSEGALWLLLSAHPRYAHIRICSQPPNVDVSQESAFLATLNRYLRNATLSAIEQVNFDRLLMIHFDARNELGDAVQYRLMVEIMGKHSNIVLVDANARIVDALKRLPARVNRYREVLPNRTYIMPPTGNRRNPLTISKSEFLGALASADVNMSVAGWLAKMWFGMSEALTAELLTRASISRSAPIASLDDGMKESLWNAMEWLSDVVKHGDFEPVCIRCVSAMEGNVERCALIGCYPIRLTCISALNEYHQERCASLSMCIGEWLEHLRERDELEQRKGSLRGCVSRQLKNLTRRLAQLRAELTEAQRADEWRRRGELLLMHAHAVPSGTAEVMLPDPANPDAPPTRIALDPALSPAENAQRMFARYKKLKSAAEQIPQVIARLERHCGQVRELLEAIECADDKVTLDELHERARQLGIFRDAGISWAGTRDSEYLRFQVADGFELLIGRTAEQNHKLITKVARPNDLWLHVRNAPGAHGILRWRGKLLPF
ncbi:MAG TPA: DUF814 domain-containing protein, partial [Armatimonadetes bacterium]|nr:DUF814 domain-containing protein [Armatimonadota bacterium]